MVARLDQDRPSTFNWAAYRDDERTFCALANDHYPGLQGARKHAHGARPVLFGEYCHLNTYNRGELASDPGVRDAWGDHLERMWEAMVQSPGVLGGALWSGIDDMFWHMGDPKGPRWVGYGEWGVIDAWRREKPEYYHVWRVYAPIQVAVDGLERNGSSLHVPIENRHDFTDLREYTVHLTAGTVHKQPHMALAPHSSGTLTIDMAGLEPNTPVQLDFRDPQGRLTQSVTLPSASTPASSEPPPEAQPAPHLHQSEHAYQLTAGEVQVHLDRYSGALSATADGETLLLVGGPQLVIRAEESPWRSEQFGPPPAPLANLCFDFHVDQVAVLDEGSLRISGHYRHARGQFVLHWDDPPWLTIEAHFDWRGPSTPLFAAGVEIALPSRFQKLSWQCQTDAQRYPADHLARAQGQAWAFPTNAEPAAQPHPPQVPWSQQFSRGGTQEFRSTKRSFSRASLSSARGETITFLARGEQHVQATLDEPIVRAAILSHYSGGSEAFYAGIRPTPTRLEPGDTLQAALTFRFTGSQG